MAVEPGTPPKPSNPALIVFGAIGFFLAVIAGFAAYFLLPRGERVGTLDLTAAEPRLVLALTAGDELNFRLDVIVGTASGYPNSSSSRSNAVHDELEQSTVTLSLMQGDASHASSRCGAYAGKATSGSSNAAAVESSGLPLDCRLTARATGRYTLTGRTEWIPRDIRKAALEVRRQKAGG